MSLIGLPSLPKLNSGKGIVNQLLALGQSELWNLFTLQPTWGIYEAGSSTSLAVETDSVVEVKISEEADVPDYRIQTGSFASYNKISAPIEVPLTITKGGTIEERKAFISWLQTATRNPTVYDVLTPEVVYQNLTLKEYSIERTQENGEGLIVAECKFLEVREAPDKYYDADQGKASTTNSSNADGIPSSLEKKVETKTTTEKSGVQNIFSLDRVKSAYTSVKTTANSIVESIVEQSTTYWEKVKGWFSS